MWILLISNWFLPQRSLSPSHLFFHFSFFFFSSWWKSLLCLLDEGVYHVIAVIMEFKIYWDWNLLTWQQMMVKAQVLPCASCKLLHLAITLFFNGKLKFFMNLANISTFQQWLLMTFCRNYRCFSFIIGEFD